MIVNNSSIKHHSSITNRNWKYKNKKEVQKNCLIPISYSVPDNNSILSFKGIQITAASNLAASKKISSKKISFMGYPVHIVDGSNHASNVSHFAKAVEKNMDIEMHNVEVNPKDRNVKQLKSLEHELHLLNKSKTLKKGDYVAVPALATVPLLNLKDQINSVTGQYLNLTHQTVKTNKAQILDFLKQIYYNPDRYRQNIDYMDPLHQGIEYTWGVINELNSLKEKGAKVYIPAGHPHDDTLKWMAGQRGLKPELYHFIATGEDINGVVDEMASEIKRNNWYDFNLLSLSEANVVTVKEADGAQDYMFAAYDTCITDGARGVYNFSPVRDKTTNKVIGYSYTDTETNEYPFEEFPANDEIENLVKFVGKDIDEVLADKNETELLKNNPESAPDDKLYKVKDIFDEETIKAKKINIQGEYTDKSLKLFFRKNKDNKVIFPKCDCEGSGKPSVLSMWGSCFAVFNCIAKDIKYRESQKLKNNTLEIDDYEKLAQKDKEKGQYGGAEYFYGKILEILYSKNAPDDEKLKILEKMAFVLLKQDKFHETRNCYNTLINLNSAKLIRECGLQKRQNKTNNIIDSIIEKEKINALGEDGYKKVANYNKNFDKENNKKRSQLELKIAMHYSVVGDLCSKAGENYPAKVCKWASEEIIKGSQYGDKIIQRRAQNDSYIGDLYDESHKG